MPEKKRKGGSSESMRHLFLTLAQQAFASFEWHQVGSAVTQIASSQSCVTLLPWAQGILQIFLLLHVVESKRQLGWTEIDTPWETPLQSKAMAVTPRDREKCI